MSEVFEISSEDELLPIAKRLASLLKPGDWVWLEGDLGAGKTTFVRHLFRYLGYGDEVVSPSYPLLVEYEISDQRYLHLDGYRLEKGSPSPWDFREWGSAIILAEWPERLNLPEKNFRFKLKFEVISDASRKISLTIGPKSKSPLDNH
jgi:tRNA threonylcarbamoyladenosine biosynthesis protein TsaE